MRLWTLCLLFLASALSAADTAANLFAMHCAPCHGPDGRGGRGPNLAASPRVRAADDASLSGIISLGIPGTQMPGTRMTTEENRALAAYVRSLGRSGAAPVPGDKANGERIFRSKGRCGECHSVGASGGRSGPDLTDVGARRGPDYLLTSLLDPAAEVPETFAVYRRVIFTPDNYLRVRLVTAAGEPISGVRVDEDTFTIQIRDDRDRLLSFRKSELRELHEDWGKSPMPGYRGVLSGEELRDVVAYLASLGGAR